MGNDSSRGEARPGRSNRTSLGDPSKATAGDAITPGMFIQQKTGAFSDRYSGIKVLGKGSFGEVVLCKDKLTGQECAVKVISKSSMKKSSSTSCLLREIELLKELDHPNIMKLFEFFEDKRYFYLVGEVYSGGELFDKITRQKKLDIIDAAQTLRQILSGINYMHRNNIVHRDLKPENLLLESNDQNAMIKIIDFGLSTHFESATKMKDKIGTAYYIAPEVLAGSYTEKCDIWSAGVILYILLTGRPPFGGATEAQILARVTAGTYNVDLVDTVCKRKQDAASAKDLIRHMLMFVPSMRFTAQQCLDHEFVTKMSYTPELETHLPALENALKNMIRFQSSQKLAKAALLYMGSKLTTQEETKDLTAIFASLDRNKDGRLDRDELKSGYKKLLCLKGIDITSLDDAAVENHVDGLLSAIDFDNNGYLDYSEFVTVCMDQKTLLTKKRLKRAFEMFDTDESGKISANEISQILALGGLDAAECNVIVKSVDKNDDGEIDLDEFESMLLKLTAMEEVAERVKENGEVGMLPDE